MPRERQRHAHAVVIAGLAEPDAVAVRQAARLGETLAVHEDLVLLRQVVEEHPARVPADAGVLRLHVLGLEHELGLGPRPQQPRARVAGEQHVAAVQAAAADVEARLIRDRWLLGARQWRSWTAAVGRAARFKHAPGSAVNDRRRVLRSVRAR
jgi:hypothetical protein